MSERTEVKLKSSFHIRPETLVVARKRVPVDHRNFIPLLMFNRSFSMVAPILTRLGSGVIEISLREPFGFMQGIDDSLMTQETQQTNGIVLAPAPEEDKWLATFDTTRPLSQLDIELFDYGLSFYAAHAESALHKPQHP